MTLDVDSPELDHLHILLVSGSTRRPSCTHALTEHLDRALWTRGAATTHWSLRERALPIADPAHRGDLVGHPYEIVRQFVATAETCDALVLCSPIYHNSYSGVLKNALDHLAIDQLRYKPVGIASHGSRRSTQAVDHLRIVVRGLLGVAIPTQICTQEGDYRVGGPRAYELRSEDVLHRIERFASELLFFAYPLRSARRAAVVSSGSASSTPR